MTYKSDPSLPLSLAIPRTPFAEPDSGVTATLASILKSASPEQGDHTSISTLSCLVNLIFVGPLRTRALEVCNRQREPARYGREVLQRDAPRKRLTTRKGKHT